MRIPAPLEHLSALTDDVGIIQHAVEDIPNRSTGYCVDDVARALIVAVSATSYPELEEEAHRLGRIYLAYLLDAQHMDGRMRNFMGYDRRWLDDIGSEDSFARGLWGLGYTLGYAQKATWRNISTRILGKALPHVENLTHLRSQAYAAIGLTMAFPALVEPHPQVRGVLATLGSRFQQSYRAHSSEGWAWFEPFMTYDNARIPEALMRIGAMTGRDDFIEIGIEALDFYERVCVEDGMFVPIGNNGWYMRGGDRSHFDQQPLEAAGMVDAALFAFDLTGQDRYRRLAELAYDWFFGHNSINAPLVIDGGCRDGFSQFSVNRNMGAESTLAYLASAFTLAPYRERAAR
jgi:hypothetical protein